MLEEVNPGLGFDIKTIKTSGDEGLEVLGAFVTEVEQELRRRHIDLAIHSLKDMPTVLPSGVFVASTPLRGEHRDCLIARNNMKLSDLPKGARIGTGSLRRSYQLKALRPDLEVVPIRGNIITRMGKIEKGEVDAVVLAAAGLDRVNMSDRISQIFSIEEMLPAVSQGALAIEVREDDKATIDIVKRIDDNATSQAVIAERAFLMALGGGCRMPIAAYAEIKDGNLILQGMLCTEDGTRTEKATMEGLATEAAKTGKELAALLLGRFGKNPL
jgi:hydroxymethylbilane synthase